MVNSSKTKSSPLADLDSLPTLFSSAQTSSSSHRRSLAALYKTFLSCSEYTTTSEDGQSPRLTGEKEFLVKFKDCVDRVLDCKKGVAQADRVVKFVAAFVALTSEEAAKGRPGDDDEVEDGPASRFSSSLLKHLLKGFSAKNKIVRFRCSQLVAQMISGLGEMDEDLYELLRSCLLERIRDKEPSVRVQAVIALSKLQNSATIESDLDLEASEDDEEEVSPTKALLRIMTHDASAEVRRAALFQLDLEPALLPSILSRTRDVDINNRRLAFQASLIDLPYASLSNEQKLQIIKSGLKDREAAVKKSATKLVGKWAGDDLLGLLGSFGVLEAPDEENKILEEGLFAILDSRRDILEELNFDDEFWNSITPVTSFLARTTISYLRESNNETRLEELLPVATALAYRIENVWNTLRGSLQAAEENEEQNKESIFVLTQLLGMALFLDFSDEAGRRKMFAFMREMISHPLLPLSLVPSCFDILSKLATNEKDFLRVVVEIVQELREDANVAGITRATGEIEEDEGSDDEAEIEAALREPMEDSRKIKFADQDLEEDKTEVHLRCLCIVQALLERVVGTLQDNSTLSGLVHEVIVPSVRSKEAEVREAGLYAAGPMLYGQNMAIESFGLFVNQAVNTEGVLQEKVYQIIFDLFTIYGVEFLAEKGHGPERVLEFIAHALEQDAAVQAIATTGIAKLTLSGVISDSTILQKLVIVYFAPETAENQDLRQCLTYFFPVYCFSSSANQRKMFEILLPTLNILKDEYNDADDNSNMITPAQIALQLVDWTDPTKAVVSDNNKMDSLIQVDLTMALLKSIYRETAKDERKRQCQLLGKLYLPPDLDEWRIRALLYLITSIQEQRPLGDAVSRNTLIKLDTLIKKAYGDRAKVLDDADHETLERLQTESEDAQLYASIQDFVREEQEREDADPAPIAKGKKAPARKKSTAPKKSRARSQSAVAASAADSDEDESGDSARAPTEEPEAPRRSTRSTRASSRVSNSAAIREQEKVQAEVARALKEEGVDEEDEELEDVEEESEEDSDI